MLSDGNLILRHPSKIHLIHPINLTAFDLPVFIGRTKSSILNMSSDGNLILRHPSKIHLIHPINLTAYGLHIFIGRFVNFDTLFCAWSSASSQANTVNALKQYVFAVFSSYISPPHALFD